MQTSHRIASLGLLALASLGVLGACASADYHYSQIFGYRYFRAPIDTYPLSILTVDGKDNVFRPALVDPGLRQFRVQGPPGGRGGIGEVRDFSLQVAPCTRYYLVAQKDTPLAVEFNVRVDYEERVAGCTPPPARS